MIADKSSAIRVKSPVRDHVKYKVAVVQAVSPTTSVGTTKKSITQGNLLRTVSEKKRIFISMILDKSAQTAILPASSWRCIMSKWDGFHSPNYTIVDLGRPAVFHIPTTKLSCAMGNTSVEEAIKSFLMEHFTAFSATTPPNFGVWMDETEKIHYDECRRYEVSFVGKEKIPKLLEFLTDVALATNEICLYVSAGQYTCLLYPAPKS